LEKLALTDLLGGPLWCVC